MTNVLNVPVALSNQTKISFPSQHVLLLTLNRPEALNAMTAEMERDIAMLMNWFDNEPELWVIIITGNGRIFCAGADLKAWYTRQHTDGQATNDHERTLANVYGFGAISRRRTSSKPMIAAVNGGAYGGGMEMLLNCDIIIADENAVFAMPEVKRGVVAALGGMPRLSRVAGHQLASEMLLLGRSVTATEARDRFRFVNEVVPLSSLLDTAISYAKRIIENSPDAVQSTKHALVSSLQEGGVDEAFIKHAWSSESKRVYLGTNIKEGLKAFTEKRKPVWTNPAKL